MNPLRWLKGSLARFYSTLIIGIVSFFIGIYSYHSHIQIRTISENRLQDQIESTTKVTVNALSGALWNFDTQTIEKFLETLLEEDNLIRVEIKTEAALLARGKPINKDLLDPLILAHSSPIYFKNQHLGEVHFYFSREQTASDLRQSLWNCFTLWIVMLLGISGTSYFFTRKVIINPILELQYVAGKISRGDYTLPIQAYDKNEIGALSQDLEQMRLSFIRFLNDLKTSHRQIQEANLSLEEKVATRTAELSNSNERLHREINEKLQTELALKIARDQAEEANRIKSQFIANMSHELRTPLTSIIGFSELLIHEMVEPSQAEWKEELEIIRSSGKHLLAIINDILDLSKIEAGRMDVNASEFSLQKIINEVAAMVNASYQKKGNRLLLELSADTTPLFSDERKIRQSLLNLISNANKFTEQGTVAIKMELYQEEATPWVRVQVKDSGVGMSEAEQLRLFQAFYQVDTSQARKHGGTGLGLAITKRFCEIMGGRIRCQSAPSHGTTMTIELPIQAPRVKK